MLFNQLDCQSFFANGFCWELPTLAVLIDLLLNHSTRNEYIRNRSSDPETSLHNICSLSVFFQSVDADQTSEVVKTFNFDYATPKDKQRRRFC